MYYHFSEEKNITLFSPRKHPSYPELPQWYGQLIRKERRCTTFLEIARESAIMPLQRQRRKNVNVF